MSLSQQKIKCVVWDLDNTLWDGVLLENQNVRLKPEVISILQTFDERGILQSIASKNEFSLAISKLQKFKIAHYFIYPQINWNSKSNSIKRIATEINISLDTIAFVDDQIFEREEVTFSLPQVLCIDATQINQMLYFSALIPRWITEDSSQRRQMYQQDIIRKELEEEFSGPHESFLKTLNMKLKITLATKEDLRRAEELTERTHQLNTTGYTFSYDELDVLRESMNQQLLLVELEDKYGSYGKIGLALLEMTDQLWTIQLLLMSCRVISRGVGSVVINYLRHQAKINQVDLHALFIPTDRNRMMYMTYKLNGFVELPEGQLREGTVLANDLTHIPDFPDYMTIATPQIPCSNPTNSEYING